jgi:hypothetical protein
MGFPEEKALHSAFQPVSEATHQMIIHHSDRLHERVTNGGTHEREPAPAEVFAHRIGLAGAGWHRTQ